MSNKPTLLAVICLAVLLTQGQAKAAIEYHQEITGPFETPMAVTEKCLECHEDDAKEVMDTAHWNWQALQFVKGRGVVMRGKKNAFNNFCITIAENWPRCTSCHIGYGWKDESFNFNDESRVDCLSCHDTTGDMNKPRNAPAGAGMPAGYTGIPKFDKDPLDLVKVAKNVGTPSRRNCINCHANGGGGNNVKHGDIDMSLINPEADIDIHMAVDGLDFTCQECHTTSDHEIKGNHMTVSPSGQNPDVWCIDCHEIDAHAGTENGDILDDHVERVACQTCHIPVFAKEYATKMSWDWSEAQNPENLPKDKRKIMKDGSPVYIASKGRFVYEKNVVPEYRWFNGSGGAYHAGQKINPNKPTKLAFPLGNRDDGNSKIMPFKKHTGVQIYDVENKYLLAPKLFPSGENKEDAYWKSFDWARAAKAAEESSGLPFSGEYGFAPTVLYDPINHMVAASEKALSCNECHGDDGRLDWKALEYEGNPYPN